MIPNIDIAEAMTIKLDDVLPEMPKFQEGIRRTPRQRIPSFSKPN